MSSKEKYSARHLDALSIEMSGALDQATDYLSVTLDQGHLETGYLGIATEHNRQIDAFRDRQIERSRTPNRDDVSINGFAVVKPDNLIDDQDEITRSRLLASLVRSFGTPSDTAVTAEKDFGDIADKAMVYVQAGEPAALISAASGAAIVVPDGGLKSPLSTTRDMMGLWSLDVGVKSDWVKDHYFAFHLEHETAHIRALNLMSSDKTKRDGYAKWVSHPEVKEMISDTIAALIGKKEGYLDKEDINVLSQMRSMKTLMTGDTAHYTSDCLDVVMNIPRADLENLSERQVIAKGIEIVEQSTARNEKESRTWLNDISEMSASVTEETIIPSMQMSKFMDHRQKVSPPVRRAIDRSLHGWSNLVDQKSDTIVEDFVSGINEQISKRGSRSLIFDRVCRQGLFDGVRMLETSVRMLSEAQDRGFTNYYERLRVNTQGLSDNLAIIKNNRSYVKDSKSLSTGFINHITAQASPEAAKVLTQTHKIMGRIIGLPMTDDIARMDKDWADIRAAYSHGGNTPSEGLDNDRIGQLGARALTILEKGTAVSEIIPDKPPTKTKETSDRSK